MRVVVEAADVLPALGADRALRLVGGVVGRLGEDRLVQALDLAAHQRHQRGALQPVGRLDPGQLAEGRVDVEVADRRVDHLAAGEAAGPRTIIITPMPRSNRVALAPGKAMPWSVVQMTSVFSTRPKS